MLEGAKLHAGDLDGLDKIVKAVPSVAAAIGC